MNTWWTKNGHTVLSLGGLGGLLGGVFCAILETPKAVKKAQEAEKAKGDKLTAWETIKTVIPCYKKTIIFTAAGSAFVIAGSANAKAAIASVSGIAASGSAAYAKYREKVKEVFGEDADKEIKAAITKESFRDVKRNEITFIEPSFGRVCKQIDITTDDEGKALFYLKFDNDPNGTFLFRTKPEDVILAMYQINRDLACGVFPKRTGDNYGGEPRANDFYRYLGLEETKEGELLIWHIETLASDYGTWWVDFDLCEMCTDDGLVAYAIEPLIEPEIVSEIEMK